VTARVLNKMMVVMEAHVVMKEVSLYTS